MSKRSPEKHDEAQERRNEKVENVTLGISILILLVLLALVIYQAAERDGGPVVIQVQPQFEAMHREEGLYYLPVQVVNESSHTATDVTITFTLADEEGPSETTTTTLAIPLLAGEITIQGVVAFAAEPTAGNLHHVLSYIEP